MPALRHHALRIKRFFWQRYHPSRSRSPNWRAKKSGPSLPRTWQRLAHRRTEGSNRKRMVAARPSGTENIYKIYAESFRGADHLRSILEQAQTIVNDALAVGVSPGNSLRKKHD